MGGMRIITAGKPLAIVSVLACVLGAVSIGCGGGGGDSTGTVRAPGGVAGGTWGNNDAELDVTDTGSSLQQKCSRVDLPAVTPDANGNFSFTGPYSNPPLLVNNAQYTGHIDGSTMQLTVTDPSKGNQLDSFTLMHGAVMPPYTGLCPG